MIEKKYLALSLELIGVTSICFAIYLIWNLAACLIASGIVAVLIGAALENRILLLCFR